MTKAEKKTILSHVESRARAIGFYTAQNLPHDIEIAQENLAAVKDLAYSLGIPYRELTAVIESGWKKGKEDSDA